MSLFTCAEMIGGGTDLFYDKVIKSYEIYRKDLDITYK